MEHDFLDEIDEHFERLMKESGNGGSNGQSRRRNSNGSESDQKVRAILSGLEELSDTERDEVLNLIQSLKRQSDLF
jgi:hypothetical protein